MAPNASSAGAPTLANRGAPAPPADAGSHAAELSAELGRRVREGDLELPVLADAAARVMRMALDEDVKPAALADAIQKDAAMAGHLLRVVNSALYRGRSAVVSLAQAVSRLGVVKVREVALAIVCQSRVFQAKGFEKEIGSVFRHSLSTAVFAREVARVKRWNVEEAFLAGLLHDMGRPVLIQAASDLRKAPAYRSSNEHVLAAAAEHHALASAALVAKWQLPEKVEAAIRSHHDPSDGQLALVLSLADRLAHGLMGDDPAVTSPPSGDDPVVVALNLYPEELAGLVARGEAVREAVEAMR